jgi:prepilin-type N-terminal cleavage/methylation domain-containing protein
MKMIHRGEKGFTLIELLIVVAILAIIAAVVIPNISRFMITGQLAAANSEVENVKTAALGYFGEYGYWPADSQVLIDTQYITGALKAVYVIDGCGDNSGLCTGGNGTDGYGWIYDVSSQTWPISISFAGGSYGLNGTHGKWGRAP